MQGTAGGWNTYARPQVNPTTADLHLTWDVPYQPGVLRAVGKRDGQALCEGVVRTAGAPASIRLTVDRDTITADPREVAHVGFEILDANGVVVPTASDYVQLTVEGGSVLAMDNANLRDLDPYRTTRRRAFNGRGLAILRSDRPGTMSVTVSADGLRGATARVVVRRGDPVPTVPATR